MKDANFAIQMEQLAKLLEQEINTEQDTNRNCRLQDAKEHLRRACLTLLGSHFENNDLIG